MREREREKAISFKSLKHCTRDNVVKSLKHLFFQAFCTSPPCNFEDDSRSRVYHIKCACSGFVKLVHCIRGYSKFREKRRNRRIYAIRYQRSDDRSGQVFLRIRRIRCHRYHRRRSKESSASHSSSDRSIPEYYIHSVFWHFHGPYDDAALLRSSTIQVTLNLIIRN